MENLDNEQNKKVAKEDTFDTTGLLLALLANWKWFVLSVAVCLVGAYFYLAKQIPMYQVNASIYLNVQQQSQANPLSMTSDLVGIKNYIDETELEVLKSKNSVIRIVDTLGLAYSYYSKGKLRNIPLYEDNAITASLDSISLRSLKAPIDIEVSSDGDGVYDIEATTYFNGVEQKENLSKVELPVDIELSQGTVSLSRTAGAGYLKGTQVIKIRNPRAVAGAVAASLNIQFGRNTDKIIRVSCTTDNIKRGADIIDALLHFYNRNIIEDQNRSAVQTEAFILDRLVMISGELKDVEDRLQAYRQTHNITDIQAQAGMSLGLQNDYEQQLANFDTELGILKEIEAIVSNSESFQTLPSAVNNPTVSGSIESYNRKVSQLNRTLEGLTPDNPLVQTMQEELGREKVRILQNIESVRRTLQAQRGTVVALENKSTSRLAVTPSLDKGLQEIFREQQVKVNIYTFLLQRREEIALQKTLATNTARLIDDPQGSGPVSPVKASIYGLALILGLAIPALIIFVRRMLFPIFSDQEELERITSVPILGEICQNDGAKDADVVVGENVSTPIAELFRLLRNNISFTRHGADSKVILVTSSVSGEGKTFIATNLALTYALMGKKVLVVGLDLRRPMLAHRFGLTNQRGVTTFLSGQEHNIDALVHPSGLNDNLFVLPAGPVPPNPNELLMSSNMSSMMTQLRNEFDYIIIDSAPIGIISDSFLILRYSDLQLYVTRARYSTKSSLKVLHQAVESGKFSSVYIVLNGVDIASNSYIYRRYGDYGLYGGKGRAYGYGYASKSKKN